MNQLHIGLADKTERLLKLAKPDFLLIDDGPIADAFLEEFPDAAVFNPRRHSFNPLKGMNYRRARDFVSALYTASPQGENTLTVRNGKRALTRLLLDKPTRLDRLTGDRKDPAVAEALGTIDDLLLSPVLKKVLCSSTHFPFKGSVVAKIDRAQLGDFDAFVVATLLIGQFKGQVIVPDFGFYGRDFYTDLIRQDRLVAGLDYLDELSPKLQQAVLGIKDKVIYRTTPEDAERLIVYTKHTNPTKLTEQAGNEYELGE